MKKLWLLVVILFLVSSVNADSENENSFFDDIIDFFKSLFSSDVRLSPGDLTCADINSPNCIELIPGQSGTYYTYNSEHDIYIFDNTDDDNYYFLLMGDMSCDKSCIIPRFDSIQDERYTTTIDLNGYTITYSDANYEILPNTGFEEWDGNQPLNWVIISGNVEKRSTDYYMPMAGDFVLYSNDSLIMESSFINLPLSNREYVAYITLGRAGSSDITIEVLDSNDNVICSETEEGYFRGKSIGCEFTPNSVGQHKLRITTSDYTYIDVTGIVPVNDYGIMAGSTYNLEGRIGENYPGMSFSGSWDSTDFSQYDDVRPILEVKNGNIRIGSENIVSYALRTSAAPQAYFHDLDIRVSGLQSYTIRGGGRIINNYLEVNMPWYFARESSIEENIIFSGEIINNTLIGGQGVIRLSGDETIIDGNFIRNNAQATNHYAIIHDGAENPIIRNNIFDPIEGSGILTYDGHGYRIYNNTFYVKTATCNVEYINEDYSTNGIRMNDYGAGTNYDNWIYDNIFYITGIPYDTNWPNCKPVTTGIFYSASGVNNRIFGNEFYINNTNEDNSQPVIGIYVGGGDVDTYNNPSDNKLIYNNYFETNDKAVWMSTYYGAAHDMWLENNTFVKVLNEFYDPTSENSPLRFGRSSNMDNLRLINNKFLNGFDEDEYYFSGINGNYDLTKKHYLHVYVEDGSGMKIENALVTAVSQNGGPNINGTSDSEGYVNLHLSEYYESGDLTGGGTHNRVYYNPYDIAINYEDVDYNYGQVNADSEETINVIFGAIQSNAIIADHNAVIDFDAGNIPDYWINEVKNQRTLLQIPGRSHAQQIVGDLDGSTIQYDGGLRELMFIDPKYEVQIDCHHNDLISINALRILKGQFNGNNWQGYDYECRNDDDDYWSTSAGREHTIDSANEAIFQGDQIDGSIFGWSFHIIRTDSIHDESGNFITFNDERRDAYFNALDSFSNNAPVTNYIYATAPTDNDSSIFIDKLGIDGLRVTQYNQDIRDKAIINNGILFDQANIENYDMNMQNQYQPTYEGNILEVRHPDWEGTSGPHGKIELGIAKAKAIWWMAARMEGWDGTPACQSSSDCGGNDCIQGICQGEVQQCTINDDCDYLDNLPCVDGVCNAGICEVSYTTNSCDDGIGCTENDICSLGSCTAGILNNSLCPENPDCEISTCTVGGCEYSNCNSSVGDEVFSLLFDSDIDDSIGGLIGITNSSPADGERGFSFDGISNYVQYGDNLNLDFPLSIASWVYLRDTTKNPIFFSDGGTTEHDGYWLYHANGKLELGYGNGGSGSVTANRDSFTTQENINLNQWVHVVGIINDSRDMQIYIDGVEVSTSETGYSESYQYSNGPVTIGRRTSSSGSNNYLTGLLEDLRVYNRALSASEVSDLFNGVVIQPECNNDNECNHLDNDFCSGTEIRHTEGICNDLFECEAQTSLVEDCNDGEFCNGEESCNLASCIDGTSPILDDEISCTVDSCDEINDLIVNTPNDSLCNNNLVCDGVETCDALNGCQDGIQIDCSGSDLVSIGTCFNNPDGIDWTWDFRNTFTSTCQEPSGSCTTGDSTITHDCDIIACGADCELNTDCAPTDCDVQDGCVGNDYYDYTNVDNDCLNDCSCESNSCGTPNIILNSPLCVACTTNEDCNGLNQDFCFGTEIRHAEGICNALFECEAQTTIVEDCAIQDNSYCSGLDIMRDIYTCNTAICEISETILEESCDDGDDTTIDECSPEGCNHTSTIIPQNQFVNINDGWNTFSLNINASINSNDLDSLFVVRYENNSWEMDVDSLSGDEFVIEPLRGYFVYSNEDKEINFSGYALPQSYDYELVSGTWNLISVLNDGMYDIPNQGLYYINPINLESNELQNIELYSGNVYWVDTGALYGPPGQVLGGFWNGLFDTIKRILF